MITNQNSIPEIHHHDLRAEDRPCNRLAKDILYQSSVNISLKFPEISQPFINLRLLHHLTHPMGSRHLQPGPHLRVPRASHVSAQHAPPAARSLPPSRSLTRLSHLPNGPTMPSTRRSLDQFGPGPSACPTRISSAHQFATGSGLTHPLGNHPRRAAPAPPSRKPMVTKS